MKTKNKVSGKNEDGVAPRLPTFSAPKMKAFTRSLGGEEEIQLDGNRTLVMELSDGGRVEVELFERTPGRLTVRTVEGPTMVHPCTSNLVEIEPAYKRKR